MGLRFEFSFAAEAREFARAVQIEIAAWQVCFGILDHNSGDRIATR